MREIINLTEETMSPWLYHGTSMSNVKSIGRGGLKPSAPPDYCWPEFDDEDEEDMPPEAFTPRIFFAFNFKAAKAYGDNSEDSVILRVPADCADFDEGRTDDSYAFCTKKVAPKFIQILANDQWISIREFAKTLPDAPKIKSLSQKDFKYEIAFAVEVEDYEQRRAALGRLEEWCNKNVGDMAYANLLPGSKWLSYSQGRKNVFCFLNENDAERFLHEISGDTCIKIV